MAREDGWTEGLHPISDTPPGKDGRREEPKSKMRPLPHRRRHFPWENWVGCMLELERVRLQAEDSAETLSCEAAATLHLGETSSIRANYCTIHPGEERSAAVREKLLSFFGARGI